MGCNFTQLSDPMNSTEFRQSSHRFLIGSDKIRLSILITWEVETSEKIGLLDATADVRLVPHHDCKIYVSFFRSSIFFCSSSKSVFVIIDIKGDVSSKT
jgi:hypothetical protein